MTDHPEYASVMLKLFTAKWNIPQAALTLGMPANKESWETVKAVFRSYCVQNPTTYQVNLQGQ